MATRHCEVRSNLETIWFRLPRFARNDTNHFIIYSLHKIFMKYIITFILSLLCLRWSVHGTRDLVLSEVYLKGNADRLEISNIGDEIFTGTITLSGATTIGTIPECFDVDNLIITGGQATVIARYGLSSYDYFQNIGVIEAINSKLVLSATGRNISLWYQGTVLDQFIVDYQTVQVNDTTTSFSKREKFWPVSVSSATDSWNVSSGYIASPGVYTVPSTEWWVTSTWEIETGTLPVIASGAWLGPLGQSGSNIVCITDINQLRISEIYFGDENHDPFIELQGLSDFHGLVTLSGTLLGLSFTIDVNITQSGYLVISRGANWLLAGSDQISESALLLYSSGWSLILGGQGGQVLDSVQIPPLGTKNIFYGGQGDGCQHFIQEGENFSPGFDERFLFYFSGSNSSNQSTVMEPVPSLAGSGAWQSTWSCPVCSICSNTNSDTTNPPLPVALDTSGSESNQGLKILTLDLVSNPSYQTITIQSSLQTSVAFSSSSVYRLHSTNRSTNNVLYGIIAPGENKQFTGNRRFPTAANCIQLLFGTEILDTFCYGNLTNSEQLTINSGETLHVIASGAWLGPLGQSGSNNLLKDYIIRITSIDYNPYGTDAGNEKIGLLLLSGDEVNLKDLKLKIWTTNRYLSGTLTKGLEQIFKGSFGFPNSSKSGQDIIISLVWQDYVFDTYVYNPEKIQPGNYYVTSVLDGDTIRIKYNNSTKSIRLIWIDAPESNKTRYGKIECRWTQAKKYLTDLVKEKTIYLKLDTTQWPLDSYDRILGYVYLNGEMINQKMLAQGYAKEYIYNTDYQFRNDFLLAQTSAKTNKLGIRDAKLCSQTTLSGEEISIDTLTWNIYSGLGVTIKNILPNPKGKDEWREYLTLIFYVKSKAESWITIPNVINLSDWWYLLINDNKKKLTGSIALNEATILTWKFAIPNKAACIAIGHADRIFDRLCYDLPQENELIGEGKQVLEDLSNSDSALLWQVSLRQINDSLCVVYMDESLICRKIPAGKTSIKLKNENKLYKNYITLIEWYLDKDWKLLLQNTKLGEYVSIFQEAKKWLKNGQQKILIGNSWVDVYDLKEQLALKYTLPSVQHIQIEIPQILERYVSFVEEYKNRLKVVKS